MPPPVTSEISQLQIWHEAAGRRVHEAAAPWVSSLLQNRHYGGTSLRQGNQTVLEGRCRHYCSNMGTRCRLLQIVVCGRLCRQGLCCFLGVVGKGGARATTFERQWRKNNIRPMVFFSKEKINGVTGEQHIYQYIQYNKLGYIIIIL